MVVGRPILLRIAIVALFALPLLFAAAAHALDPERHLVQYKHTRWVRADGAPSPIYDIEQTRDGFLWLATGEGLFRFDGLSFDRIDPEVDIETQGAPYALFLSNNGDLWIRYGLTTPGRFAVYRDGRLHPIRAPSMEGTLVEFAQTRDGAIWVGVGEIGRPLFRYRDGRWQRLHPLQSVGLPRDNLLRMIVAPDGALWLTFIDHVLRLPRGGARFEIVASDREARPSLAIDREGRVWGSGQSGTWPLSGPGGRWPIAPVDFRYRSLPSIRPGRSFFDRDGNLWIARGGGEGLERLRTPSPSPARTDRLDHAEVYRAEDGLTANAISSLFEDREGTIWVGTAAGLDSFRNASVAIEPMLTRPGRFYDALFAASDGQIYVAQADAVYRVPPGGSPILLMTGTTEPEHFCEDPQGTVWLVLGDRIVGFSRTGRRVIDRPASIELRSLGCAFDARGRFWLTGGVSGIFGRRGSRWEQFSEPAGDGFYPGHMATGPGRTIWLQWADFRIARWDGVRPTIYPIERREQIGAVRHLRASDHGLLIVGDATAAFLSNGRMIYARPGAIPALRGARGTATTPDGYLWALGRRGLARMRLADVARAFREPGFVAPARIFDDDDGLPGRVPPQAMDAVARGGDGRIWAATLAGTVWIDPARLPSNPLPPPVAIASLSADGHAHRDPASLRLPAGTADVAIAFAALSLAAPERVQVRYRLEGHDGDWIDPGARRQAFYTNLTPGTYRFRVIAANEDGIWNRAGATLEFAIPPTFLQSIWFKLLLLLAVGLLGWLAYSMRLRQVTTRLQGRFAVRMAERERIARELHDTLLQGFQALVLRLQAIADKVPAGDGLRGSMEEMLERADNVMIEGRSRVLDLRNSAAEGDPARVLLNVSSEIADGNGPQVVLTVHGAQRDVAPPVMEEIRRFAEEAIHNVVHHAQARRIDLLLDYGAHEMKLAVRDDGVGIPMAVLAQGERPGHLGLVGMRERAEQLGGDFTIGNPQGGGAEVALTIPARTAYLDHRTGLLDRIRGALRRPRP